MLGPLRDDPPTRAVNTLRVVFGGVLVVALVLGYIGFGQLLSWSTPVLDLLYYDLQLFVLGADQIEEYPELPILLQIARFAAPSVTVYAFVEAGRLLFAVEWRRMRAYHSRGHAIVCGDGAVAAMLTRRLGAAGRRVVAVRSTTGLALGRSTPLTVFGDPRDPEVLQAAGVRRATAVYACTDDSTVNTAIAMAAGRAGGPRSRPLAVYVYVRDPELCLTLQARYLGLPHPRGLRLDFFNLDDLAARKLFSIEQLDLVDGRPPRLLVVGATEFGRSIIVEAARRWRMRYLATPPLMPVTVVDQAATAAVGELTHRYPFLRMVCRFTPYDADLIPLLAAGKLRDPPDLAFVCCDDEEHALKTAMTAERLWRGGLRSVVVRLDRLAAFRGLPEAGISGSHLFDESASPLRVFGVVHAACDPQLIGEDLVERLARVLHDQYRLARGREGDNARTNQAMVAWEDLPSDLKESNREQARDIGRKLREIGCVLVPRVGQDDDGPIAEDQLERLARMEHERWRAERGANGWRYAERRDPVRRLHPGLRDWEQLSEPLRRRNHETVRELPMILSDAGFQVVRAGTGVAH